MTNDTNWLPETVTLRLTMLEAGYLAAVLQSEKKSKKSHAMVNKPGPNGEPVPISMVDRLIEKLHLQIKESS